MSTFVRINSFRAFDGARGWEHVVSLDRDQAHRARVSYRSNREAGSTKSVARCAAIAFAFASVRKWVDPAEDNKIAAALPVAAARGGAGSAPGTTTPSPAILDAGSPTVAPSQSTGTHGKRVSDSAGPEGAPAPVPPPVRAPIVITVTRARLRSNLTRAGFDVDAPTVDFALQSLPHRASSSSIEDQSMQESL